MDILCLALRVFWIIVLARVILSWVSMSWSPPPGLTPVIRVVYDLTEPVLGLFRRFIPPVGGLDLSPLVIFLILSVARNRLGC